MSENLRDNKYSLNGSSSTYSTKRSSRETANVANVGHSVGTGDDQVSWGAGASRSLYNVNTNTSSTDMLNRNLLNSRLWKGVPQLTEDQIRSFEPAYTGHQFLFVINVPKFMTTGYYENKNLHAQMKNLKSVIERASTSFSDGAEITAQFDNQDDGAGRKMSHMVNVTHEQNDITIRLHEFAGLPVKNALESWLTGVYDINSQHGNYFGNLGIPGGWCTANHTMSLLVVQTDPSWTEIQDAAYYYNMMPNNVPFDHWNWTKGESQIVQDADITFNCNRLRNPAVMYAAEKYMNARILSLVSTSVFNTRQFVPTTFSDGALAYNGFEQEIGTWSSKSYDNATIIDDVQYNAKITNSNAKSSDPFVKKWYGTESNKNDTEKSIATDYYNATGTTDTTNYTENL